MNTHKNNDRFDEYSLNNNSNLNAYVNMSNEAHNNFLVNRRNDMNYEMYNSINSGHMSNINNNTNNLQDAYINKELHYMNSDKINKRKIIRMFI